MFDLHVTARALGLVLADVCTVHLGGLAVLRDLRRLVVAVPADLPRNVAVTLDRLGVAIVASDAALEVIGVIEIASGEFLFLTAFPDHFGSCIRVVTQSALSAFAKEAKRAARKFRRALTPLEKQLFDTWHRNSKGR